jgi:hypothetical protein
LPDSELLVVSITGFRHLFRRANAQAIQDDDHPDRGLHEQPLANHYAADDE